ncbi:tight junction-associated protein 1 isoform X2 [Paralichthys olivaceus]|uniref:tight junction-associated protein 1 isoform X2 n=1 Tax=Paralichthys olivaceus TaxID=8255 RepID=UPI0037539092
MTSSAPARKPYRKAPPQHRETRHAMPVAPTPPAPQPDINQVKLHAINTLPPPFKHRTHFTAAAKWPWSAGPLHSVPTSPLPFSDSEPEVSSLSSLELSIPSPSLLRSHTCLPNRIRTTAMGVTASDRHPTSPHCTSSPYQNLSPLNMSGLCQTSSLHNVFNNQSFPTHRSPAWKQTPTSGARRDNHGRIQTQTFVPPKGILKQPASLDVKHTYNIIRKSKSVELLDDSHVQGGAVCHQPTRSLDRAEQRMSALRRSSAPPLPSTTDWTWKMQILEEKVRFSNFLDEITCQVLSPAHLTLLGRSPCVEPVSPAPQLRHQNHRPAHRKQRPGGSSIDRTRRWDDWVTALQRPSCWYLQPLQREGAGQETPQQQCDITEEAGPKEEVLVANRGIKMKVQENKHRHPFYNLSLLSRIKEALTDADRIRILQQQNEDLRHRLSLSTHKMEAMEAEFDGNRHYMEAELSRTRDDLDKMRDKFRRLQNSYTASQRANQDLEEKLHALLRKVERDKKTMDQEIVELTNKLLDAKNTIDRLEELNERYRHDCNLAVQLLKCNKSHFRNHKFADLPSELQDMLNKHMKTLSGGASGPQDPDTLSLTPADVVPTSVIARVLEKPEPLVLNSAQSSSCGRPVAEDVFVHVDMTGPAGAEGRGRDNGAAQEALQQNGSCRSQSSLDGLLGDEDGGGAPSFEKLNPYPVPPPPHPLYPGRKVIEFSSDDKVKIPKNSPLPNCTYATRQAISLSLVQNDDERLSPGSPVPSSSLTGGGGANQQTPPSQRDVASEPLSSQSSPFSSPPQALSVMASSGSSEEDLLSNWQRMFVEKMAPTCDNSLVHRTSFSSQMAKELQRRRQVGGGGASFDHHRTAYSDGEEGSSARSWTPSRGSSLDTDTDTEPRPGRRGLYGGGGSVEEGERLLMNLEDDGGSGDTPVTVASSPVNVHRKELEEEEESSAEERDVLPHDLPVISPHVLEYDPTLPSTGPSHRPQKSPKRMGVHHLHRKDSLTRAQEQGTLLD